MTEADWNQSTQTKEMLEAVLSSGRVSERKLRLFAAACVARAGGLLADARSLQALEVAEAFAEGTVGSEGRRAARRTALAAAEEAFSGGRDRERAAYAAYYALALKAAEAAWSAPLIAAQAVGVAAAAPPADYQKATAEERGRQASLVRCIFGPALFRELPRVAPAVLAWNGGMVGRLAAAYEAREFTQGRLGVLADAAEEAGLTEAELLGHLRGPGPHVRGCWGVDLLLGRA
jgi:hypothetical protein